MSGEAVAEAWAEVDVDADVPRAAFFTEGRPLTNAYYSNVGRKIETRAREERTCAVN